MEFAVTLLALILALVISFHPTSMIAPLELVHPLLLHVVFTHVILELETAAPTVLLIVIAVVSMFAKPPLALASFLMDKVVQAMVIVLLPIVLKEYAVILHALIIVQILPLA
jgi:hypothetical protein